MRKTIKVPQEVYNDLADYSEQYGVTLLEAAEELLTGALAGRSEDSEDSDEDSDYAQNHLAEDDFRQEIISRFDRLETQHRAVVDGQMAQAEVVGKGKEWIAAVQRLAEKRDLPPGVRQIIGALPSGGWELDDA